MSATTIEREHDGDDDIRVALKRTADSIKRGDDTTPRTQVERRLVLLMRQVAEGKVSDFFEVSGRDEKGREMYVVVGHDERGMAINRTIPQWQAPRRHCRLIPK